MDQDDALRPREDIQMFIRLAVTLLAALSVFAQTPPSPSANLTIGFLIFPGIQALDVMGPVELFNMLKEQC